MALIDCKECGEKISDKAEACPKCGIPCESNSATPKSPESPESPESPVASVVTTIFIICFFIGGAVAWFNIIDNKDSSHTTKLEFKQKKPPSLIPPLQAKFVSIASDHRAKYLKTTNQLVKDSIDDIRLEALKKVVKSKPIKNWVGKINYIDSTVFDEVILSVTVSDNLEFSTSINTLLFANYETLIKDKSDLKRALFNLELGQKIIFSGSFPTLEYNLLSDRGSALHPILLFKFSEIKPL